MTTTTVNGFICFNCTDTERAHKGIDPAHPHGRPGSHARAHAAGEGQKIDPSGRQARIGVDGRISDLQPSGSSGGGAGGPDTGSTPGDPPAGALLPPGVGAALDVTV